MLRIGVIGTGNIAETHLQAYKKNPDAEIYALCDLDEPLLKKRGEQFGVQRLFTNYADLLKLPEIDAVSVCTWNSQHAPVTIAALEAGKHVLCEKPMATSAAEAEMMLKTARKSGKLLMIGFVRRFGNDCDVLKEFIDRGDLGEIYYVKASYLRRHGNPGGWFGDKTRSGGGPLIDLGVHVIDLTRYLMGNPDPVSVYGATFRKLLDRKNLKTRPGYLSAGATDHDVCDVEDLASAMIRYDNGAVVTVEASFSLNLQKPTGSIELFGTKAGARLDPSLELYSEWNGHMTNISLETPTALSFSGLFENEINHFVRCVSEGIPCRNPAEDGVTLMRILDAVYESARTGHEVVFSVKGDNCMKIGIGSYSYLKYMNNTDADYIAICDIAKNTGFDGIEFTELDLKVHPAINQKVLAENIRRHCEKNNLSIFAYTVGADFLARGPEEAERIKGQVDIAEILGAPLLRHDATWAKPGTVDWRDVIDRIKHPIREVTEYAALKGIRTCTENHGLLMQDSDRVESLIRAVGHSNYGWLVDIGNFLCADELPIHALPIAAPYAFHVHAKDFLSKPGDRRRPGRGLVQVAPRHLPARHSPRPRYRPCARVYRDIETERLQRSGIAGV